MIATLAYLHYLALGLGFVGVFSRGRAIKNIIVNKSNDTKELFLADNIWGIAALLWIVTGLMRAFGTYEKGPSFYMNSHWFWLKMTMFACIFVLEIYPMITFMKWRKTKKQVTENDYPTLIKIRKINHIEALLVFLIPFVATIMARGGIYWQ